MPKISVIVPVYNVELYVEEAINSLLSQTNKFYEIIVVDDGSTDNSAGLLRQYQDVFNVTIITQKNQGLGAARNVGVEKATGDYIYFFDSDDVLANDFVEKCAEVLIGDGFPDILFFSGKSFGAEQEELRRYDYDRKIRMCSENSASKALLLIDSANSFFPSACLYVSKLKIWKANDLKFKSVLHEDTEIIFRLFFSCQTYSVIPDVFFYRRLRSNSIVTKKKTIKNLEGQVASLQALFDAIIGFGEGDEIIRSILKKYLYYRFRAYIKHCIELKNLPDVRLLYKSFMIMVF